MANDFASSLDEALAAGDVAAFQLRLKHAEKKVVAEAVRLLKPICHRHGVAFVLNDAPELAVELACDGVHIGRDDGDVASVRALLPSDITLGVSCYDSIERARSAVKAGADYVAFGAMFPTTTKQQATPADPSIISVWKQLSMVPCAAIGGITMQTLSKLLPYQPNFLALSAAIWHDKRGAAIAVQEMTTQLHNDDDKVY